MKWEILNKTKAKDTQGIVKALLKNRKITKAKGFFDPKIPQRIRLSDLGVKSSEIKKTVERIKKAKKQNEKVIIYGDYDADGICATAIMWEATHKFGLDVLPHIPDRFSEGYGINVDSVNQLKSKLPNLSLIITVDNGIVAHDGITKAKELGIDVIVIDHHQLGKKKNNAKSIIHSPEVCGSTLSYLFAKEIGFDDALELAAIGTIADQMPLTGINRSIVKYGLKALSKTNRPGLLAIFDDRKEIGTYEVNYILAPRINAMGRLKHGIDSLRLICTKNKEKARELAKQLNETNYERQRIVDGVVIHTRQNVSEQKIIVLADESYHEGVIGLAAGKLVEEFYRPAIVISKKGEVSKASARSISGFNIIENIMKLSNLILQGGGHPMAAGFSLETSKIEEFRLKINELADEYLTDEILEKKLKVDLEIEINQINMDLVEAIKKFDPTGIGNPAPTFLTSDLYATEIKSVGQGSKHLKLKLKSGEQNLDAIFFGGGELYSEVKPGTKIDVVYNLEENIWNGNSSIQLKIKDINC